MANMIRCKAWTRNAGQSVTAAMNAVLQALESDDPNLIESCLRDTSKRCVEAVEAIARAKATLEGEDS